VLSNTLAMYCKKSASFDGKVKFSISIYILQVKNEVIRTCSGTYHINDIPCRHRVC